MFMQCFTFMFMFMFVFKFIFMLLRSVESKLTAPVLCFFTYARTTLGLVYRLMRGSGGFALSCFPTRSKTLGVVLCLGPRLLKTWKNLWRSLISAPATSSNLEKPKVVFDFWALGLPQTLKNRWFSLISEPQASRHLGQNLVFFNAWVRYASAFEKRTIT